MKPVQPQFHKEVPKGQFVTSHCKSNSKLMSWYHFINKKRQNIGDHTNHNYSLIFASFVISISAMLLIRNAMIYTPETRVYVVNDTWKVFYANHKYISISLVLQVHFCLLLTKLGRIEQRKTKITNSDLSLTKHNNNGTNLSINSNNRTIGCLTTLAGKKFKEPPNRLYTKSYWTNVYMAR